MQPSSHHRDKNLSTDFPSGKSKLPSECVRQMGAFLSNAAILGEEASWLTGSPIHARRLRTLARRICALQMPLHTIEQAVDQEVRP
jgi:hypothetical protein